jgi:hypothetical protein
MSDHKVGTREPALANAVSDLPTQFESLLDTIWRCERIWALEDRIAASAQSGTAQRTRRSRKSGVSV